MSRSASPWFKFTWIVIGLAVGAEVMETVVMLTSDPSSVTERPCGEAPSRAHVSPEVFKMLNVILSIFPLASVSSKVTALDVPPFTAAWATGVFMKNVEIIDEQTSRIAAYANKRVDDRRWNVTVCIDKAKDELFNIMISRDDESSGLNGEGCRFVRERGRGSGGSYGQRRNRQLSVGTSASTL